MNTIPTRRLTLLTLVALGCCSGSRGEEPRPLPGPPRLETLTFFLSYYEHLRVDIRRIAGEDRAAERRMCDSAAVQLHVEPEDFDRIEAVAAKLRVGIEQIDKRSQAYLDQTAGKGWEAKVRVMNGFEEERQKVMAQTMEALRTALSKRSWTSLQAYLDGDFRKGFSRN